MKDNFDMEHNIWNGHMGKILMLMLHSMTIAMNFVLSIICAVIWQDVGDISSLLAIFLYVILCSMFFSLGCLLHWMLMETSLS